MNFSVRRASEGLDGIGPETNTSKTVLLKEGVGEFQNLRGGSQIIPYGDDRICIIHEVDLWKNKLEQKEKFFLKIWIYNL